MSGQSWLADPEVSKMAEKDKTGFLAAQIELAQKSIATWPKWLQEVSQVEDSGARDQTSVVPDAGPVDRSDAPEHQAE